MIDLDFNLNFGKRRVILINFNLKKSGTPFSLVKRQSNSGNFILRIKYWSPDVQSRTRYRDLWESRFARESLRLPTSEQLVQPRVCPSCRRKILARFLKPGPDRKLRLVPTKPCYLSFPASLFDPRTENVLRRIFFLERGALQFCNRSCIPLLSFNLSGMFGTISFRANKMNKMRNKCDLLVAKAFSIISEIDVN